MLHYDVPKNKLEWKKLKNEDIDFELLLYHTEKQKHDREELRESKRLSNKNDFKKVQKSLSEEPKSDKSANNKLTEKPRKFFQNMYGLHYRNTNQLYRRFLSTIL